MKKYTVNRAPENLSFAELLSSGKWNAAEVAKLEYVREESRGVPPAVEARLLYGRHGLLGRFLVKNDRCMRCVCDHFQDHVCADSCCEFFVEPSGGKGYVNFEFSGAGVFLCSHITDPTRTPKGFAACEKLTEEEAAGIISASTLPRYVEELDAETTWELGFFIPFAVFERRGFSAPSPGEVWRGNFYKCGDKTRYPHWLCWSPVDALNFHLPRCFGELEFA